jgi:NAD(P)-dependent dehydrogenase (short-subunit alcohol dehydrogenase family)
MTQVAIVTGVTEGFGAAVAAALIADGSHVVGDARSQLSSNTAGLTFVQGDICDETHLEKLVATASRIGSIQLLVNNAGALGPSPLPTLAQIDASALDALFRVNVNAQLRLIQICLPLMRAGAAIVNVSSDAAVEAYEGWGAYGATKAALDHVTAVLAVEQPGLRVYSFDPGDMRTRMHQEAFPDEDISDRPEPDAAAPALLALANGDRPSGRYRVSDL